MKFLWFDTETTGTDPKKNGIIQLSGMIVVGGVEKDEFDFRCNVHPNDEIEQGALDVNGKTREEIASFDDPKTVYSMVAALFDKYIDRYDKQDKFFAAGQNVGFDVEFTNEFFKKNGNNPYFFSYVHSSKFDTLNLAMQVELKLGKRVFFPNYKLESLCKCMGVKLDDAHDALADIRATRLLAKKMWNIITGESDG
jgi:DNA polymerase-3 subunit epsilon